MIRTLLSAIAGAPDGGHANRVYMAVGSFEEQPQNTGLRALFQ
ncbi:hypothetical protein [Marinicauda salina]|nr:hypothetical protein [Marinicauda salina]